MPGEALRAWRLKACWTQEQASQVLCVTLNTVARWERSDWPIPGTVSVLVHLLQLAANRRDALRFVWSSKGATDFSGEEMHGWRQRLGWTQPQAAHLLRVDVNTIYRWEHGEWDVPGAVRVLVYLLRLEGNRHRAARYLESAEEHPHPAGGKRVKALEGLAKVAT